MNDIQHNNAVVFSGYTWKGAWSKTLYVDPVFEFGDWPYAKDVLTRLEKHGVDTNIFTPDEKDYLLDGLRGGFVQIYPVLLIDDVPFALTPFQTDKQGNFPPQEEPPDDDG